MSSRSVGAVGLDPDLLQPAEGLVSLFRGEPDEECEPARPFRPKPAKGTVDAVGEIAGDGVVQATKLQANYDSIESACVEPPGSDPTSRK